MTCKFHVSESRRVSGGSLRCDTAASRPTTERFSTKRFSYLSHYRRLS
jgi:hypothetical protein